MAQADAPRASRQQKQTKCDVQCGTDHDQVLQTQQRHANVHGKKHADDGAHGVGAVDQTDAALPCPRAQQRVGDERQRHAGAQCCRQHDHRRDALAQQIEFGVASQSFGQHGQQRLHRIKAQVVERQRRQCRCAHQHLHPAQKRGGRGDAINAPAHPEPAQRQAQDEGEQHQFEGVGGTAQHQAEHADPADLVHEGRDAGQGRNEEQQSQRHTGVVRGRCRRCALQFGLAAGACQRCNRQGQRDVEAARQRNRSRQTQQTNQPEARTQHTERTAQAVGKVKRGNTLARLLGKAPDQARAHQGKGHAQQHRLRQDQQRADAPFHRRDLRCGAQMRDQLVQRQINRCNKDRMKNKRQQADDAFNDGVAQQQIAPALRQAATKPGTQRHATHEDAQHQALRVSGVAQKKLEIVGPDRLVNQSGKTGDGEQPVVLVMRAEERLSWLRRQRLNAPERRPAHRLRRTGLGRTRGLRCAD